MTTLEHLGGRQVGNCFSIEGNNSGVCLNKEGAKALNKLFPFTVKYFSSGNPVEVHGTLPMQESSHLKVTIAVEGNHGFLPSVLVSPEHDNWFKERRNKTKKKSPSFLIPSFAG